MKNIYIIKETCPMFSLDYKVIKPYIFTNKEEANECVLDYEYISADRVLCTEYELINLEVDDNLEKIEELIIEGEKIKIRQIINGDYDEEFRYDIHRYEWLDSAGRINNIPIENEDEIEDYDDWVEHDYLYSGYENN